MPKWILRIGLALLVVLIVALVIVYTMLGRIVRTGVETIGPEATGTKVTLADVDIGLLAGRAGLGGFIIGNPKGFKSEDAFKLKKIGVDLDVGTITKDVVVVESVLIDGAEVTWEGLGGDNLKQIKKNIERYSAGAGTKPAGPKPEGTAGPQRKVIIDDFVFQNGAINVVVGGQQIARLSVPNLHLTDIGRKEGGQTLNEVLKETYEQVFGNLNSSVAENREMLKKKMAELKAKGEEMLKEVTEPLAKGKESVAEAKGKAAEGLGEVTKGLGDIFKKE